MSRASASVNQVGDGWVMGDGLLGGRHVCEKCVLRAVQGGSTRVRYGVIVHSIMRTHRALLGFAAPFPMSLSVVARLAYTRRHAFTHTWDTHTYAPPPLPPGFYGTDCCLSLDADGKPELLAGQGYLPRKKAPKIYVYELPPFLNNIWCGLSSSLSPHPTLPRLPLLTCVLSLPLTPSSPPRFNPLRLDRPLFYLFWQRLLSSGVRVADGEEADYYFLPIKVRGGGI